MLIIQININDLFNRSQTSARSEDEDDNDETNQPKRMRMASDTSSEFNQVLQSNYPRQCDCDNASCEHITIIDID